MQNNKAVSPPRGGRNVSGIMAALAASGLDDVEAARYYARAQGLASCGGSTPDLSELATRTAKLCDEGKEADAYQRFLQAQAETERVIRGMREALNCIKRGIRWQTGLHKAPGSDPLPTSLPSLLQ